MIRKYAGAAAVVAGLAMAAGDTSKLLRDPALLATPQSLATADGRTSTVYRAEHGNYQFNLHSYLTRHEGKFWAVWSSGLVDEDSNGQLIRYASSADGHTWSEGRVLAEDPDGAGPGRWIARGVFVLNGRLSALLAYVESRRDTPAGIDYWPNLRLVRYEWHGRTWKDMGTYADDCMNNFPPRKLGKLWFMTCRNSYRKMDTALSPDGSNGSWKRTPVPSGGEPVNLSEPSWYVDDGNVAHLLFRDQGRSGYLRHSISKDDGRTWSPAVLTNYPDATSKNFTGRLSNGWYFLINNPAQKSRDPLGVSFSRDGWSFAHPVALRKGAPDQRYPGRAKGRNSFQYPHAMEHGGSLWVIYSTNKEDIEITEYPLSALTPKQ